jgi:hypothetical protein
VVLLIAVQIPLGNQLPDAVALAGAQWWTVLGLSLTVPSVIEGVKAVKRSRGGKAQAAAVRTGSGGIGEPARADGSPTQRCPRWGGRPRWHTTEARSRTQAPKGPWWGCLSPPAEATNRQKRIAAIPRMQGNRHSAPGPAPNTGTSGRGSRLSRLSRGVRPGGFRRGRAGARGRAPRARRGRNLFASGLGELLWTQARSRSATTMIGQGWTSAHPMVMGWRHTARRDRSHSVAPATPRLGGCHTTGRLRLAHVRVLPARDLPTRARFVPAPRAAAQPTKPVTGAAAGLGPGLAVALDVPAVGHLPW